MNNTLEIYGTKIVLPERDKDTFIENWDTDNPKEQYWQRKELPDYFDQVEYDKEGNALLTPQQRKYAAEEVRRCKDGFWFYNNGIETYITGKNYFYLTYWKLEDDIFADYRDTDRRYFIYLNHWEKIMWCLGIARGKKRREGASSQATSNLVYECIFYRNSFCGLVSKTERDSKTTFTNMVAFGYRQLPVFLKPKQLNNKDSVTELVFAHKSTDIKGGTGSAIDTDTGHRSKVDYRAPGLNAYDSGRLSRLLFDEGGKWPVDVPASKFLGIVSKTLIKGGKRVGFCEAPSTVNEMSKGGGAEYKKIWDSADNIKFPRTPNRFVRYFTPAFDGYLGFIDRHGMSVIDVPTEEQYEYLAGFIGSGDLTEDDIRLGAKQYLIEKRSLLEGSDLEEEIRMNPFDEREMFLSANTQSLFAAHAFDMREQVEMLNTYEKELIERGDLIWDNGHPYYKTKERDGEQIVEVSKLKWVANPNGIFEKIKDWKPVEQNNVYQKNGSFFPNGNFAIRIGCDPFKYDKTKQSRRSNCSAYAFQIEDPMDEGNAYNDVFVMRYVGRPPTTDLQYENVLKMAWYCGCQVLFERNVDGWKKYLSVAKCSGFAMWLPNEVEPGIYTDGSGKTVQMICDYTEAYIDKAIKKVYFKTVIEDWLQFVVEDTEKSDETMSAGFALIGARAKKYIRQATDHKNIEDIMPYRKAS